MKILITGGGCEEPIDNVRSICNFSTGKTSTFLSRFFLERGHDVTAVMAKRAVKPEPPQDEPGTGKLHVIQFKSFNDLQSVLKEELERNGYDAVIHAAAVSDYSPYEIEADGKTFKAGEIAKINSGSEITVKLKRNPKILDSMRSWSRKDIFLAGFKLTSNADEAARKKAVWKIFDADTGCEPPDAVVSNDLSEITEKSHPCRIYSPDGNFTDTENVQGMAEVLLKKITARNKCVR